MVLVLVRGHAGAAPEVYMQGFGETAPGSGVAPNAESILRLCSLSKIFATDLLNKLVADGTVRLDDELQTFAPPSVLVPMQVGAAPQATARGSHVAKPAPHAVALNTRPITLEDLATHTSGLAREVGTAPHDTPHFTFPSFNYRWHWLPNQRLKSVPGAAALYSNVGFDLLGDALQSAAHEPYAKLLADRTTRPLDMKETGFTPNANQCARLLQGNHDEGPCTDTQNSAGSSGVYSTPTDMATWLKYLLYVGPTAQDAKAQAVYIDPATLVSQSGLDHAGDVSGIGIGWMHVLSGPEEIVEKTGGGAGFVTYIALNHATQTGLFAAFTDGEGATHYNVFKAANNLLLTLSGFPPAFDPAPPKPAPKAARKTTRKPVHH